MFDCLVMGPVEDSIPAIFRALQEAASIFRPCGPSDWYVIAQVLSEEAGVDARQCCVLEREAD